MGYEEFRNIDDLTHEQIIEQEINEIVTKKGEKAPPRPKKEEKTVEEPKEEIKTEKEKPRKEVPDKKEPEKKVKKAPVKKTTKSKKTQAKKKPAKTVIIEDDDTGGQWLTIIVSAIAILAIIVVAYLLFNSVARPSDEQPSTVAALVNGQPIYTNEVELRMGIMQSQGNLFVTEEEALDETISQKLFVQEAERQGYEFSRKEVEDQLKIELEKSGFTTEELKENLASQGLEYEDLISFYEDNFLVMQLVNDTILSKALVSDADVEDYYESNKENFRTFDLVQLRHILVGFNNKTENETLIEAQKIKDKVSGSKDNFCDLVETYSDDSASIDSCGEYNFTRSSNLVPEFLEAGFSMDEGEIRTVKTQFGYHIMYKIAFEPSTVAPFDEVKNAIADILQREYVTGEIDEMINELKENAIIEVYTTGEVPKTTTEPEVIKPEETPVEEEKKEEVKEMPKEDPVVEEAPVEEPKKEEVKEPEVVEQPVKETVVTEKSEKKDLVECLADKDATMYTVYWSPDNEAQLELLGDSASEITVIECDSDKADAKTAECEALGVNIYPSWVIDGELLEGTQGTRSLSLASGCI